MIYRSGDPPARWRQAVTVRYRKERTTPDQKASEEKNVVVFSASADAQTSPSWGAVAGFLFQKTFKRLKTWGWNHPNIVRLQFLRLPFLKALGFHNTCHLTIMFTGSRGRTRLCSWLCDSMYVWTFLVFFFGFIHVNKTTFRSCLSFLPYMKRVSNIIFSICICYCAGDSSLSLFTFVK